MARAPKNPTEPVDETAVAEVSTPTAPRVEEPVLAVPVAAAEAAAPVDTVAVAAAPTIPLDVPGPGVGAEQIAAPVTAIETVPLAEVLAPASPRPTPAAPVIDAARVPGARPVRALTQILHDGRTYAPGDEVELTYAQYAELVTIGAVEPVVWPAGR